jgi:hypothetical protein
MWNLLDRVIGSSWSSSTRGKVARRHRRSSQPQRRFECLETRHLLAASPVTFSQASVVHLNPISVSQNTGEKPESKLWQNDGHWWSVMPDSSGTWIWRLDGSTWNHVLQLSTQNSFHADVLSQGAIAQILLFDSSSTQLATVEYVAGGVGSYSFWSQRQSLTPVGLSSSAETATIAVDSAGRLWVASDVSTTVEVRYSDGDYSSFSAPITIGSGISTDDISDITMLPDGSVGILWSNQNSKRFYFRTHQTGADAAAWSTTEVAAGQAALNVGAGMADDHMHIAVASDGTLYAAVKTSYDTAGKTKIGLIVRRPNGTWDPTLYNIATTGTRPVVLLDESIGRLIVAYTSSDGGGDILYAETALDQISFSSRGTLMTGGLNNVTTTKQNVTNQLVFMAEANGKASSVLLQLPIPVGAPANQGLQVQAGADQIIQAPHAANLHGTVTENGSPPAPGSVASTWTQTSGPGIATFTDPAALDTAVTFGTPGTYVLRLTADDGTHVVFDELAVTVKPILAPTGTSGTATFQDGINGYSGTRDATILAGSPNTNQGATTSVRVDGSPDVAALLRWDIGSIPTGVTVKSATITLNITTTSSNTFQLYELKQNWSESGATWNRFSATSTWATAGAQGANDRGSAVLGTIKASSNGKVTITLNAAGIAVVQKWINNPGSNFGLTIQNYANSKAFAFDSSEASAAANRPKLSVTYTNAAPAMLVTAGSDQVIDSSITSTANLHGSFAYSNLAPLPSNFTAKWSVTSSPASSVVNFADATALDTAATFSDAGIYVLRLTIDDGVQSAFGELTIAVS